MGMMVGQGKQIHFSNQENLFMGESSLLMWQLEQMLRDVADNKQAA